MFTIKNKMSTERQILKKFFLLLLGCNLVIYFISCASSPEASKKSTAAQKARDAANKALIEETGEGIGIPEVPKSVPGKESSAFDEPEIIIAQNVNTNTKQPAWVNNPQNTYPSSRYLSAVGSGRSTGDAENAAIAAIARIIKQNVSSSVTTREKDMVSSTGTAFNQASIDEIIETYSVVDALVGVRIGEFWWDKNDIVYAIAYVDKQEAAQYYTKKINENERLIMEKIALAKASQGQFSSFSTALQSLSLAEENEQYIDILYAMDPNAARARAFQYGSVASVKDLSYTLAQNIAIDISVVGDDDRRIGATLSTMLSRYGFKPVAGLSNAHYLLDAAVSYVDVPADRNFFVRFIFSANLKEKKTDKILLPYSNNKREGHINAEGAKERAIQSLLTSIQEEYAGFFVDFLRD